VEAWRIFYRHLTPDGVLTFSRWAPADSTQIVETLRIFSLAWDTLMSERVDNPADHLALIRSDKIATLLVCNAPFGADEATRIRRLADRMQYQILYLPGQPRFLTELNQILTARSSADLANLRYMGFLNFAPVHDFSPFFFNFVRPSDLPRASGAFSGATGSVAAIAFLLLFTLASLVPDILFIDVEGFEVHALKGATHTLQGRPDCFIEVHVGCGLRNSAVQCNRSCRCCRITNS
jgi:hypothetical protein